MRHNNSVPVMSDFSYLRYEHMRTARSTSHSHLPERDQHSGIFSRTSSLADLAYVALPGLTSRVARNQSVVSLANLTDAFSEMPENESPVYIEGGTSRALLQAVAVSLLSTLMYGFNNGNMNTPAPAIRSSLGIPPTIIGADGATVRMHQNDTLWGFVVSIFALGALVGCNSSSQLADRWGRKTFLLWNSILFVVGALMEAAATLPTCTFNGSWEPCTTRVGAMIVGRAVAGIACGGVTVVVPMYLGEVSPAHLRGTFGTLNQLTMVIGMLAAQVVGLPSMLGSAADWPLMMALILPIALLQLLVQPVLLESPRWYAMYGNEQMAEEMLVLLRDRSPDDPEILEELYCMLHAVQISHDLRPGPLSRASSNSSLSSALNLAAKDPSAPPVAPSYTSLAATARHEPLWHAAATNPAVRRASYVALTLMLLQQLSGINNAFNFSSAFLQAHGLDEGACMLVAIGMNVANVIVTIASVLLMDSAGRRPLLLFSLVAMIGATCLLTFALSGGAGDAWTASLAATAIVLFVSAFGIGLGPVPSLLPAEIFPAAYRSGGSALAWSTMWLANFFSAQLFLTQAAWLGPNAFVPHAIVLTLGTCFALMTVPETRGKSLEAIEREMSQT